ncbi:MAG TPA: hypothetical protein VGM90_02990 [Kofleriaceae bacterium]|jgi:hypothetical protein
MQTAAAPVPAHPQPKSVAPSAPIPDAIKKLDRAALDDRLRKTEAAIFDLLPAEEQFDVAAGGAENEPRARAAIDRVFGTKGNETRPYDLECRGDVCRFQTDLPSTQWSDAIQRELVGFTRDMALGGDAVYFHVELDPEAQGTGYEGRIANALSASLALARCHRDQPADGSVTVAFRLVDRRVEVDIAGPHATDPAGSCVRKVVEDLVSMTPLPDDVTVLPTIDWPVPLQ